MHGQVLSGGADWNLVRSDGAGSVDAAYYLRTDDGVVIRIVNKGIGGGARAQAVDANEQFFMVTAPVFEAPREDMTG
jgi:azurin